MTMKGDCLSMLVSEITVYVFGVDELIGDDPCKWRVPGYCIPTRLLRGNS